VAIDEFKIERTLKKFWCPKEEKACWRYL